MMQTPPWLASLVWTDYRLAIVFTVLLPLILLIWAFVQKNDTIQHLLVIYWRVASLLAITVYLFIGALPTGFISGWLARILIPISLWFWVDLNEEIAEQSPNRLKFSFTTWRWAVSIYCLVGAILQLPVLQCALMNQGQILNQPFCQIWLQPPWAFREYFHATTKPFFLGFLGIIALVIYILYLAYFILVRLGRQGRSAMGQ